MRRVLAVALLLLAPVLDARALSGAGSTCVSCHAREEDPELADPVPEWRASVHGEAEVSCDGCHGGDPREEDADLSMSEDAGYVGTPPWFEMAAFCGACHEAIADGYTRGTPGATIRAGRRAPTCATCHMASGHDTERPDAGEILAEPLPPELRALEHAAAARETVLLLRERERELASRVEAVEARALPPTGLAAALREVRAAYLPVFHEFDRARLAGAAEKARQRLSALAGRARALEREAARRTRYGLAVIAALGALAGVLGALRARAGAARDGP